MQGVLETHPHKKIVDKRNRGFYTYINNSFFLIAV